MDAMQVFLNKYPDSKFKDQADEVITVSHNKLEEKGFHNAKQYLTLRNYAAANIAFDNFRKNFPDSKFLEEVAYLKVLAQYSLAEKSFPELQPKRFKTVIELYQEFVDSYPQSRFLREAERMYSISQTKVDDKLKAVSSK
jgi:outer membrane protein assembly factor BamD